MAHELKHYVEHYAPGKKYKAEYETYEKKTYEKIYGQVLSVWGSPSMHQDPEELWTYNGDGVHIEKHSRVTTIDGDTDRFTSLFVQVDSKIKVFEETREYKLFF
jgi:hypothetical protein